MAMKKGKDQPGLRDHREAVAAAAEELPPLIAVAGESEYLRANAVETLRSAWLGRYPDGDTAQLRGVGEAKPLGLADITRELSGGSLFARNKLVIARQTEKVLFPVGRSGDEEPAPGGKGADREKAFVERLKNPAPRIWLLLETAQLPRNRVMGKRLAEHCRVIPCPLPTAREVPEWLFDRARSLGMRFDDAAADMLQRAHGTDLGVLAAEVEKLALFAGDRAVIDAAAVSEFLTGTIEFDVFNFTNAVEARNIRQAAYYARRITMQGSRDQKGKREDGERSAHRIMFMLSNSVLLMLRARVAMAQGLAPVDFAAEIRQSPWRVEKIYDAAGRYSLRELRHMAAFAAGQLRSSHDTGGDAALSLELLAVKLTRKTAL